jgi:putative transposase
VIDELLACARTEGEIVGPGGVLAQLTKRLVKRAIPAELTERLGYEPPDGSGNTRNGSTLAADHRFVELRTTRDRKGTFKPQIVREGAHHRFEDLYDKILGLYSRRLPGGLPRRARAQDPRGRHGVARRLLSRTQSHR